MYDCNRVVGKPSEQKGKVERGCAEDESQFARRRKWCCVKSVGEMWGGGSSATVAVARCAHRTSRRVAGCVNCGLRPRWQSGRVFQAPHCTDRFAKPSVMQGVPLPTRGRSRTAGRKSGTRRSGAAARAASARPATPVKCQCRVSVASRTLKVECCASPTPTAGLF